MKFLRQTVAVLSVISITAHCAQALYTVKDLFTAFPSFFEDFDQILVFTDTVFKHKSSAFYTDFSMISLDPNNVSKALHHSNIAFVQTAAIIAPADILSLNRWMEMIFDPDGTVHWHSYYFILWPEVASTTEFESILLGLKIKFPLQSDVYWFQEDITGALAMWETYSIKETKVCQLLWDNVDDDKLLLRELIPLKWVRRENFHGVKIIATGNVDESYLEELSFTESPGGSKVFAAGYSSDIYRIFRDHLNFTEKNIRGDRMFGESSGYGLERIQAQLEAGTADISVSQTPIAEDLASFVHFLHPSSATWQQLRFKEPQSRWKFFILPFDSSVWVVIAVYCAVMVAFASIWRRVLTKVYGHDDEVGQDSVDLNCLWILGTVCMQGWYDWPSSTSMRTLMLIASTTGFLLNAAYSGVLTSQLSTESTTTTTLYDLLDAGYKFFLEGELVFPVDLNENPQWHGVRVDELYDMNASVKALKKVLEGKYAFTSLPEYYFYVAAAANYTETEACELCTAIRAENTPSVMAMAVNKTSELSKVFNILTLKITERGILRRLYRKYKKDKVPSCNKQQLFVEPQTLTQLFLAYAVLIVGWLLGFVIFLAELLLGRVSRLHHYDVNYVQKMLRS